jgi:dephospho-CoA kinase
MKVIGLTGGIGSGKSAVANFMAKLGAVIIDADKIGRGILESDIHVQQQVFNAFGQQVFTPDGIIDRRKLAARIFADKESCCQINRIMHPPIYAVIKARLEQYRRQGVKVAVIEAPLLLEADWVSQVDEVWVTTSPRAIIIDRLERKGFSYEDAMARIRSQMPNSQRRRLADVVIHNNDGLDKIELKVERLWHRLQFDTCK